MAKAPREAAVGKAAPTLGKGKVGSRRRKRKPAAPSLQRLGAITRISDAGDGAKAIGARARSRIGGISGSTSSTPVQAGLIDTDKPGALSFWQAWREAERYRYGSRSRTDRRRRIPLCA